MFISFYEMRVLLLIVLKDPYLMTINCDTNKVNKQT